MQLFIKIILFQKKYVCALPCVAILVGLRLYLVQSLESVSATKKQKANQIGSQKLLFQKQLLSHSTISHHLKSYFQLHLSTCPNGQKQRGVLQGRKRWGRFYSYFNQTNFFTHNTHNSFFTAQNPQHPFTSTFNCEKFVVSCVM